MIPVAAGYRDSPVAAADTAADHDKDYDQIADLDNLLFDYYYNQVFLPLYTHILGCNFSLDALDVDTFG